MPTRNLEVETRQDFSPADPLVTVVVPNYNHRNYLPRRLETIFAQTFSDYELLLLDDASSDGSVEFLRQFADRPGVRLLVNESNSGSPFAQWNRGVHEARGKYVWIAESDDEADPRLLEVLVDILERMPNVGIATCRVTTIDETGEATGTMVCDAFPDDSERWARDFIIAGTEEIRQYHYVQTTIHIAGSTVFRKSVYLQAGDADDALRLTGDWWQWAKMLTQCDLYFVAEPLAKSRIHSASQRQRLAHDGSTELECLLVQQRIKRLVEVDREMVRKGAQRHAISRLQALRAGRYCGSVWGHAILAWRLCLLDFPVAVSFLMKFPFCYCIWTLKKLGLRKPVVSRRGLHCRQQDQ